MGAGEVGTGSGRAATGNVIGDGGAARRRHRTAERPERLLLRLLWARLAEIAARDALLRLGRSGVPENLRGLFGDPGAGLLVGHGLSLTTRPATPMGRWASRSRIRGGLRTVREQRLV